MQVELLEWNCWHSA